MCLAYRFSQQPLPVITINNVDAGTLAHIVRFIYTDMLPPDVMTDTHTLEAILMGARELRMARLEAVS